eukprot:5325294-Pyramimonas_sp.AAC.1
MALSIDGTERPLRDCRESALEDVAKFKFQGSAADEAIVQRQIAELRAVAKNQAMGGSIIG